jgi:hypothetical protein
LTSDIDKGGVILITIFQVCFYVGIGLIAISFLFGNLFETLGIDGLDLDFDMFGIDFFLPVSPILYILFSVVFGGVGWILMDSKYALPTILILVIAIGAGIAVSTLLNFLIIKPLKKAQNTSTPNAEDLIGLSAVVTETIIENGFGEISYIINGNSYTSPAKTTNGDMVKTGKEVAICWIEEYIFYVTSMDDRL